MTGGSPSLRRSPTIVIRTVLVKGSAFSSQTRSSSSSEDTARPAAPISTSSTPNSFGDRSMGWPARVPVLEHRRAGGAGAPGQRLDAGDELRKAHRLRHVVVGAER